MLMFTTQLAVKRNQQYLLHDFNWQLQGGEIWGLLGANGIGKTTLLHTLAGLHQADSGKIIIKNKELDKYTSRQRAQQIGVLFQTDRTIFPQTVWAYCKGARFPHSTYFSDHFNKENVNDQPIITRALMQVDLFADRYKKISELSGGERRRLAIASVLAQTPHIYLLDEPTNHLDIKYQYRVLTLCQQLAAQADAAVVMALHDVNLAAHFCTHLLLLLPEGRYLQGKASSLLTTANLSMLYQHPMQQYTDANSKQCFWLPEKENV